MGKHFPMEKTMPARSFARIVAVALAVCPILAGASAAGADPLAAIDLNRNAIIADIVQGFEGDRAALTKRLAALRADRLLSASLASTRASLESILLEAEKSHDAVTRRSSAKALGSDLAYTPLAPCRLIDTRGLDALIQGGAFAPNERRAYVPNGKCSLPVTGVASILISFTTENLTPNSGGYLAILPPAAPVTASVDVFNFGAEWSASNTAVASGPAAQFDVLVALANAHVVIDVLGYFAPPQAAAAVKSITAGSGLTGGTITDTGTISLASAYQLPQTCTNGQVAQSNGAGAWSCVTPVVSGGTVTGVSASAPLASTGGNAPNISLAGAIAVANGGTGQASLAPNAILYGQGAAAIGTAVGVPGQVLAGTAGAPAWTDSCPSMPSIGIIARAICMPPLSRPRFFAKAIGSAKKMRCGGGSCFRRHSLMIVANRVFSASVRVGTNSSFAFGDLSFDASSDFESDFAEVASFADFSSDAAALGVAWPAWSQCQSTPRSKSESVETTIVLSRSKTPNIRFGRSASRTTVMSTSPIFSFENSPPFFSAMSSTLSTSLSATDTSSPWSTNNNSAGSR